MIRDTMQALLFADDNSSNGIRFSASGAAANHWPALPNTAGFRIGFVAKFRINNLDGLSPLIVAANERGMILYNLGTPGGGAGLGMTPSGELFIIVHDGGGTNFRSCGLSGFLTETNYVVEVFLEGDGGTDFTCQRFIVNGVSRIADVDETRKTGTVADVTTTTSGGLGAAYPALGVSSIGNDFESASYRLGITGGTPINGMRGEIVWIELWRNTGAGDFLQNQLALDEGVGTPEQRDQADATQAWSPEPFLPDDANNPTWVVPTVDINRVRGRTSELNRTGVRHR